MRKKLGGLLLAVGILGCALNVYAAEPDFRTEEAEEELLLTGGGVPIDETNFPDANFREYILENVDGIAGGGSDGELSAEEVEKVTDLPLMTSR